uniref:PNK FHA domain-containing protein n=1 Tax=Physcomitrium patens TaxID=3218 RepID=A0A7I3ZYA7_PHYPA
MLTSKAQLGRLQAVEDDGSTLKSGVLPIALFEGPNSIGRDDLVSANKQVSRKHVVLKTSSDCTFELSVIGQNPVVIKSGSGKRKLLPNARALISAGDIIEFLPGKMPYKLTLEPTEDELVHHSSRDVQSRRSSQAAHCEESGARSLSLLLQECKPSETKKKRELETIIIDSDEDEQVSKKQKQQLIEDEAFAQAVQAEEDGAARASIRGNVSLLNEQHIGTSSSSKSPRAANKLDEAFGVDYEAGCRSSSTFRLMQVKGLPQWANKGCVNIRGVIQGDVQVALLSNYMVDIDWLLEACPRLKTVPSVVIFHGESGGSLELLQARKPNSWLLHKPPLRLSYGTHHTKAMFLLYPTGIRIVVHTANLIYIDWNNKSQGLWTQDFPYKNVAAGESKPSPFENDLVEYLQALEWTGCIAIISGIGEVHVDAAFFRKFDYSSAMVRLVASVPGYHLGRNLTKWGHLKLRTILQEQHFEEHFKGSPCVYQFSSLGSLDEKWMGEFGSSIQAGSTFGNEQLGPGPVQIVWPTVEDIRNSLEGYAAGGAVPSPLKNVERAFLSKYWYRWQADHTGRSRAIPHIKTFLRYNDQRLAWFLLTSSNLSKAAWGVLQKNGSQLMIRSYELGVLFLPSLVGNNSNVTPFSCTYSSSILCSPENCRTGRTMEVKDNYATQSSSH